MMPCLSFQNENVLRGTCVSLRYLFHILRAVLGDRGWRGDIQVDAVRRSSVSFLCKLFLNRISGSVVQHLTGSEGCIVQDCKALLDWMGLGLDNCTDLDWTGWLSWPRLEGPIIVPCTAPHSHRSSSTARNIWSKHLSGYKARTHQDSPGFWPLGD